MSFTLNHLKSLESEAIYVIREAAAQFQNPTILISGGKDSIAVTYLARKAFYPAPIPFPLVIIFDIWLLVTLPILSLFNVMLIEFG